jgi:cytochrome c peroxidase
MMPAKYIYRLLIILMVLYSCKRDAQLEPDKPTPYVLELPQGFPQPVIPPDNPLTVEGVELGRHLFYEKMLSDDNTMSCATCHQQQFNFSDPQRFSKGITGAEGTRNSMVLTNLAYQTSFFWDGRAQSLEQQIFEPVRNPIEMNTTWHEVERKLNESPKYRKMFFQAFGTYNIDSVLVSKAIAQFLRTLISANSKFDKYLRGEVVLTQQEFSGMELFMRDKQPNFMSGADCFHCHNKPLFMSNFFSNNGLDATFSDLGRGGVTGNAADMGRFRIPTLRNIEVSGPYMHDGRFNTLDEVINHYSEGLVNSATIDPLMKFVNDGGVLLTNPEKAQLKAFLLTLTDHEFLTNPKFSNPHPN